MRGFDIVKIERIQNKPLWEVFQWYVRDFHVFGLKNILFSVSRQLTRLWQPVVATRGLSGRCSAKDTHSLVYQLVLNF